MDCTKELSKLATFYFVNKKPTCAWKHTEKSDW